MEDSLEVMKSGPFSLSPILVRRPTDKFFILLLPINFLLWLGLGIYDMCIVEREWFADRVDRRTRKTNKDVNDIGELDLILLRSLLNITIYTVVSAVIVVSFFFVATTLKAKFIVYTALLLIVFTIVGLIILIPWELVILISDKLGSHTSLPLIIVIVVTVLYLIYEVTIFVCTTETNVTITAELINKSCTAILQSFKAVLLSFALAFLAIIVLMLTINISLAKTFDAFSLNNAIYPKLREKELSYVNLLPISIFFVGGIYTFNFLCNFGFAVMSDYFANFHARSYDQKHSDVSLFQSIARVLRFHVGTVAFLSIPIVPSVCALTVAFKTNEQYSTKASSKLINFFSKLSLVMDISEYILVNTSIYGCKALKSITELFDLQRRSSLLFFTLNAISTKAIEICVVVATIIGMIIRIYSLQFTYQDIPFVRWSWKLTDDMMLYQVIVVAVYINVMCKSVIRAAMCTFSIYQVTGVRMSETLDDRIAIAEQSI